jgi:hypothetical protein
MKMKYTVNNLVTRSNQEVSVVATDSTLLQPIFIEFVVEVWNTEVSYQKMIDDTSKCLHYTCVANLLSFFVGLSSFFFFKSLFLSPLPLSTDGLHPSCFDKDKTKSVCYVTE